MCRLIWVFIGHTCQKLTLQISGCFDVKLLEVLMHYIHVCFLWWYKQSQRILNYILKLQSQMQQMTWSKATKTWHSCEWSAWQIIPSWKHVYVILTPQTPLLYRKKWGLQGYTLFFLFLLQNIDCEYPLEPPQWGSSNEYPQSLFWAKITKRSHFFF